MRVHNVNGKECSSHDSNELLQYWREEAQEPVRVRCAEMSCLFWASAGVPVQSALESDEWFIVPLCDKHAQWRRQAMELIEGTVLIQAPAVTTAVQR